MCVCSLREISNRTKSHWPLAISLPQYSRQISSRSLPPSLKTGFQISTASLKMAKWGCNNYLTTLKRLKKKGWSRNIWSPSPNVAKTIWIHLGCLKKKKGVGSQKIIQKKNIKWSSFPFSSWSPSPAPWCEAAPRRSGTASHWGDPGGPGTRLFVLGDPGGASGGSFLNHWYDSIRSRYDPKLSNIDIVMIHFDDSNPCWMTIIINQQGW